MKEVKIKLSWVEFSHLLNEKEVTRIHGNKMIKISLPKADFFLMQMYLDKAVENSLYSGKVDYNPEELLTIDFKAV